jgi:hypothetical protein
MIAMDVDNKKIYIMKLRLVENKNGTWDIFEQVKKKKLTIKGVVVYYKYVKIDLIFTTWKGKIFNGIFRTKQEALDWVEDYKLSIKKQNRKLETIDL